jgi:hypothetical protein
MHIEKANFEEYKAFLNENSRPPSRGGNTRAWHQHRITIAGEVYSFRALGTKQWVYKNDTVSFEWEWDTSGKYRNIKKETLQAWDKNGCMIIRGYRDSKLWRISETRLPCSRREARD